ncbi:MULTISPECIES: AAA family ATPase [unclassified Bradyrhizobium]|uniref:AAA family ATPase n=1 Tax=unclassified Bradyrhizobium TaxID=2631580 RepID=UPI0020B1B5C7|nr:MULTISPECIES: AAA family ATPase [unclassified Bradyrhizobium]MCP3402157.1 AAA family ATPase [Bradyrhizobium sp. CCGB20]MCP3410646.1 AAA family ATPase [Bradyrhizobium sp. CCGB01]
MLKKIIAIKNVGRFRNSAASGNRELARHSFIVGANGYGKTTICAIMRSLKTGDASHITGRKTLGVSVPSGVELLFDTGAVRFDGAAWTTTKPAIAIFDGVFVAENVHSGDVVDIEQKRNLYRVIVGEQGVRLAQEDARLAQDSRAKTAEITGAAKAINPHVPAGMKLESFVALPEAADIAAQIIKQQQNVDAAKQASAIRERKPLVEFPCPDMPSTFVGLLGRTIDDIAADAEQLLKSHLASHGMSDGGANWVARGLEHASESCPFCGQDIAGLPLVAAYRSVFSERYKALADEIASAAASITQLFGETALARLETLAEQNSAAVIFWSQYCDLGATSLDLPAATSAAARDLAKVAAELLRRKASAPLEAIELDAKFNSALAAYEAAQAALGGVNNAIKAANATIVAKKTETGAADLKAAEAELTRLRAVKTRHMPDVKVLCDAHTALVAAKEAVDAQKDTARAALDAHTKGVVKPYENRINAFLDAFNAGFTITETKHGYPGGIATSSYQLVINNVPVDIGDGKTSAGEPSFKNTLSAGDRTTLALAFFLAHLERDPEAANTIVMFDDPFNSQDAFRRRQTVHEIMKLAASCRQLVVLSHDATFLKQLWDKAPHSERACLGISDQRSQGSKLSEIDLERATQGRTATDIDDLQTYLINGAGTLVDVIRKMRVVLETYCRTTYPSSFLATEWLGDMVGKIRTGGASHPAQALYDELDQINGYTSQYHHGENMGDITPDQIDPVELTGYVRRTLRIVNALQA